MSEKISWTLRVQAEGGPFLAQNSVIEVDAYDKIAMQIVAGTTNKEVQLQPNGTAGKVRFVMIKSYPASDALSYTINSPGGDAYELDGPHILIGKGAVKLMDSANTPTRIFVSNSSAVDAAIEILLGRGATP